MLVAFESSTSCYFYEQEGIQMIQSVENTLDIVCERERERETTLAGHYTLASVQGDDLPQCVYNTGLERFV